MTRLSIVIRTPSGLSGDMLLAGLSRLAGISNAELGALVDSIGIPGLTDAVRVEPRSLNGVSGWHGRVDLPHEHSHRTRRSIVETIQASGLERKAKALAIDGFCILAEAEARVHGIEADEVCFHEVGALDSILDMCLSAALLAKLDPMNVWCSPLPVCDGAIHCAHGVLASPAPAVQEMLSGIPVYGIDGEGETVTPTAIAFLKAAKAQFGKWPACTVVTQARVYGDRVIQNVPNGAMFFAILESP